MDKYYVAIAGNIGVGKSTLTHLLSQELGWEAFYEAVDDNPYLSDFYRDMRTWSFHSQIYFLSRRLRHHRDLSRRPNSVIQDRTVYEDAEVFARNLYRQGLMSERDYTSYRELYEIMRDVLPPPSLLVYLRASAETLHQRIALRGREYEREITPGYLEQLNVLYEEWVGHFDLCPVLILPADALDYAHNQAQGRCIAERIVEKLAMK